MNGFAATPNSRVVAPKRACRRSRANGHTLIEILLALGLSLVILTAVYAALDQHWRYAEAGQQQTERMQVTRALFERISLDLRSAVLRPFNASLPAGPSSGTRIDVLQPDDFYAGRSIGIIGDGQTLVVQVNTPDAAPAAGSRVVRWAMLALEAEEPSDEKSAVRRGGERLGERKARGLARIVLDKANGPSLDSPQERSKKDLLAAEVETLRFRYFARGVWFEDWDSVGRQALPQAVEITIGFRSLSSEETQIDGPKRAGEYRLLVPIPAAEG
jgi:type II secretory pathway component PulJ